MTFIDGVVGICRKCGGEISYLQHVFGFQVLPTGVEYKAKHSCGEGVYLKGSRQEHRVITSWLRWATLGEETRDYSDDEYLIVELVAELSKIENDADIRATFGS